MDRGVDGPASVRRAPARAPRVDRPERHHRSTATQCTCCESVPEACLRESLDRLLGNRRAGPTPGRGLVWACRNGTPSPEVLPQWLAPATSWARHDSARLRRTARTTGAPEAAPRLGLPHCPASVAGRD